MAKSEWLFSGGGEDKPVFPGAIQEQSKPLPYRSVEDFFAVFWSVDSSVN